MKHPVLHAALAGLALSAATAHAGPLPGHPALRSTPVATPAAVLARDASPALVGHPASPRWRPAHANTEHPAVTLARRARDTSAVDPNTFLVQPPASVRWTAAPPVDTRVAAVAR